MNKPIFTEAVLLSDVSDRQTIQWIQSRLAVGGYLADSDVDGVLGDKTTAAFIQFKEDSFLSYPKAVGPGTIDALEELSPKHEVSEQNDLNPTKVNPDLGKKTGPSATLPLVGLVYANEMILPDSYITWGEMTRNFSRMPLATSEFGSQETVVRNMQALAKAFQQVRQRFGSPIAINSAYRPPNLAIGARFSQHKYARALDVRPLNGDYQKLLEAIKSVSAIKGIGLAGPRKGFWHMDIRPGNRVSFRY